MQTPPPDPRWWDIVSVVVSAAATAALAFFGGVQLYRESKAAKVRKATAQARVSATAFLLRRQLQPWSKDGSRHPSDLREWIHYAVRAQTLDRELDAAVTAASEMVGTASDAPSGTASIVNQIFVTLVHATRRIRDIAASGEPGTDEVFEYTDRVNHAHEDLLECIDLLDGTVIDRAILHEEGQLKKRREADSSAARLDRLARNMVDRARSDEAARQPK